MYISDSYSTSALSQALLQNPVKTEVVSFQNAKTDRVSISDEARMLYENSKNMQASDTVSENSVGAEFKKAVDFGARAQAYAALTEEEQEALIEEESRKKKSEALNNGQPAEQAKNSDGVENQVDLDEDNPDSFYNVLKDVMGSANDESVGMVIKDAEEDPDTSSKRVLQ